MSEGESINQGGSVEHGASIRVTVWELASHIAIVTAAFVMIFGVALILDVLANALTKSGYLVDHSPLWWALFTAKYLVLIADSVFFVVLVAKKTWRALLKI